MGAGDDVRYEDLRTYLTAQLDQLWAAAARSNTAGVAAVIAAMESDGFASMAAAVRITLFVHGRAPWTSAGFVELSDLSGHDDGAAVTVTGTILDWVSVRSAQGRPSAVLILVDAAGGAVRVQVPPRTYDTSGHLIARGDLVAVAGHVDRRDERPLFVAERIDEVTPEGSN